MMLLSVMNPGAYAIDVGLTEYPEWVRVFVQV
jgi:hypothetical protein